MARKSKYKPAFVGEENEKKPPRNFRQCHVSGCQNHAEYKAPLSREHLDEYIWFCLEHIKEYNKQWDYFKNLNEDEIWEFRKGANHGHRPTWKFGMKVKEQEDIIRQIFNNMYYMGEARQEAQKQKISAKERKALDIMGLDEMPDAKTLKKRYKELVKKHHPDANLNNPHATSAFQKIQEAYNLILKAQSKLHTN